MHKDVSSDSDGPTGDAASLDADAIPTSLSEYLNRELGEQVSVRRLSAGHSNLTYVVTGSSGTQWILRRPPFGRLQAGAHDVMREYRVLDALSTAQVRVPRVTLASTDAEIFGAPFYLMERQDGEVIRDVSPEWFVGSARRELVLDLAVALAEIHNADPTRLVEAKLGRESGYLARQLKTWGGQWESIKELPTGRDLQDHTTITAWLTENYPGDRPAAVVHGDYKLDNVLVDPATARITAVLDWEMATVGDPLADLGYLLYMTPEPGGEVAMSELTGSVTAQEGCPSHTEIAQAYREARSGDQSYWTPEDLVYYQVLGGWKLATLLEVSYQRHLAGTTDDPFFAELDEGVPRLLSVARSLIPAAG
ncbi:Putative phosphotransferase [Mycobacteroides abscessus subsp. abscessus]|uniref:Phosphotransferase n=4 Tax=Mycobacteroides abscessus TaxID=36809 RepID=B1ML13_MYCA9|nr:phosphotransferase family protein [Mycobacteroides abscessus]EUA63345.1 phosphotransferase enzyme family protein [Mycobacteroides abscessus 1948]ALM18744.1 phosphotransferase [Mycobacteroides abscessus]AMU47796.1 phosphotransferase [Mycobacteroides abscessus]AMU52835.1 phosphotransferase [Mycobacteroides abscessus]AMU57788.1 phosphotransferase [Mycobacteroides abscessus]